MTTLDDSGYFISVVPGSYERFLSVIRKEGWLILPMLQDISILGKEGMVKGTACMQAIQLEYSLFYPEKNECIAAMMLILIF
jgi:hypothetical protein